MSGVAFIDTETTGLDPERCPVWEIAVIVDDVEHCWQQRLPDACGHFDGPPDWDAVSQWVLDNTGILDRYDHDAALRPAESMHQLIGLVGGRHLVGACPWFDSERLHRIVLDLDARFGDWDRSLRWHYHLIDVEALSVGYLLGKGVSPPPLPWDSGDLSRCVGVDPADFEPKHSAITDARWAKAVYEKITGAGW